MSSMEVFFDYSCPFCYRGHQFLKSLHSRYPQTEILWRPCEAHPRPERYGRHSDLCIQGMLFAKKQGADLWEYHDRMYQAAVKDRADIENIEVLKEYVKGLLEPDLFQAALEKGEYLKEQQELNRYAYQQSGVWAVPSYRMDGKKLDAVENIGVTRQQLETFMRAGLCEM